MKRKNTTFIRNVGSKYEEKKYDIHAHYWIGITYDPNRKKRLKASRLMYGHSMAPSGYAMAGCILAMPNYPKSNGFFGILFATK